MRIPLHKSYRAFPELDRFDDETCKRFMKRAVGDWSLRLTFALATLFVMIFGWAIAGALAVELVQTSTFQSWANGRWGMVIVAGVMSLVFFAGPIAGMLTRDMLLHSSVRWLIRQKGTCLACGYSLLGLIVPPDLRLTCPECGQITVSSPALHELTVDADGRSIVKGAAD